MTARHHHTNEPVVANALLRCTCPRLPAAAKANFVKASPDMDIWVCELEEMADAGWNEAEAWLLAWLAQHLPMLRSLRQKSTDYTLHLAVICRDYQALRLSPECLVAAGKAGFGIEVYDAA